MHDQLIPEHVTGDHVGAASDNRRNSIDSRETTGSVHSESSLLLGDHGNDVSPYGNCLLH